MIGELKAAWVGWGGSLLLHGTALMACGYLMVRHPEAGVDQAPVSAEFQLPELPADPAPEHQETENVEQVGEVTVSADPVPPAPMAADAPTPEAEIPLVAPSQLPVSVSRPVRREMESSAAPARKMLSRERSLPRSASRGARQALPDYLRNPPPVYPESSRLAREEGVVMVAVTVSASGHPVAVELGGSSRHPALDQAALTAVRRWKFRPATADGIPVPSRVAVPVRFELH